MQLTFLLVLQEDQLIILVLRRKLVEISGPFQSVLTCLLDLLQFNILSVPPDVAYKMEVNDSFTNLNLLMYYEYVYDETQT